MKNNRMLLTEHLIRDLMGESNQDLVVKNEDRFHLEDYIQYYNKPGIIVAILKGNSEYGVQQLPIGAVDNFRFMKVTNENAIVETEKNNGRTYDEILDEYEKQKDDIICQWTSANGGKLDELKYKYGKRFIGMDIIQNDRKIQPKDDGEDDEKSEQSNNGEASDGSENGVSVLQEQDNTLKDDKEFVSAANDITKILKNNEDKLLTVFDEKISEELEKPSNKGIKEKIQKIMDEKVGDKKPEEIDKNTQSEILKEIYKIEKELPKKITDTKWDNLKKFGISDVDKLKTDIEVIENRKQNSEKEGQEKGGNDNAQRVDEGVIESVGQIFGGIVGAFKLGWSALSLIWAHPMAAGTMCLLFYILGKNKNKK